LKRLAAAFYIDYYIFGMSDGTVTYLTVGQSLRRFGKVLQRTETYEVNVILDAVWSDCPRVYALMNAVKQ
jgi:hypothetical protein